MSTTAATEAPAKPPAVGGASSYPARLISFFSGPVGFTVKIVLLGIVNAIAIWAGAIMIGDEKWLAVAVLVATTAAIDWIYLSRRTLPLKFLAPGTLFLLAFLVLPIIYNVNVAFTNWSTGHQLTKDEAIAGIQRNSLEAPADGKSYVMAPARDEDGELVLLLVDEASGDPFVGTPEGLEPLPEGSVQTNDLGVPTAAEGYTVVTGPELLALDAQLRSYTVPTEGDAAIRPEGLEVALEQEPTLQYDAESDTFTRVSDSTVFSDNGEGSFVAANGDELEPGWRTRVGLANFSAIVNDPLVRDPFVRVFIWTVVFATGTVFLSFALGLFLAIVLDKPGMRLQRTYRSLLIFPWAIPSFLTLLVWAGLLNDDFGVVNKILGTHIPWLFDANWAKVSILLVSTWLTFPYFFLVSLGALQSVPGELVEAARVDGAGPWQVFRRITLPLLLLVVTPLLIASFAFNFNNFNNIYLLTGGGPAADDQTIAGTTDILISYTWKVAFESGKGSDYGLASALSIAIFFIVGTISATWFWRSKTLETVK